MRNCSESLELVSQNGSSSNNLRTEEIPENDDFMDRERFNQRLADYYENKANKKPFTRKTLRSLLEEILVAKAKRFRKDRREYHILKTYDTLVINETEQVIRRIDKLPVIAFEDLYDSILPFHIQTNHGGKTKLEAAYKLGKVNIPRPATEVFLQCCQKCQERKNKSKNHPVEKPKYTKGFSHQGQIDVLDFHKTPCRTYRMVLTYRDHCTKFLILRPLQNASPQVVAEELLNIFMLFGAPKLLGSSSDRSWVEEVLVHLKGMWSEEIFTCSEIKGVGGNHDLEKSIISWMEANQTSDWVSGLNHVQWEENFKMNTLIGRSPYQAVFGFTPSILPVFESTSFTVDCDAINSCKNLNANTFSVEDVKSEVPMTKVEIDVSLS